MLIEFLDVIFSPGYFATRRQFDMGYPAFEKFGAIWDPLAVTTWVLPLVLAAAGFVLLLMFRRRVVDLWDDARGAAEAQAAKDKPS
jgi:hypothetical protein